MSQSPTWFGPRALRGVAHGHCGCCGCYGVSGADTLLDTATEFRKYDRYPDPMRLKLVIAGLPPVIQFRDNEAFIDKRITGFDRINGTYYWPVVRTNYSCISGTGESLDNSQEIVQGGTDNFTPVSLEIQRSFDGGSTWEDGDSQVDEFDECLFLILMGAELESPHFRYFAMGFDFAYIERVMPGNVFTPRVVDAGRKIQEITRTFVSAPGSSYHAAMLDSKRFPTQSGSLAWVRELHLQDVSGVSFDSDLNATGSDYSEVWDGSAYKTAGTWSVTLEEVP